MQISPGATGQSLLVAIYDNNGLPVTGLVAATFPTLEGVRIAEEATAFPTLTDLADQDSAFAAGGVKEYGSTGRYRVDPPDSLWATECRQVEIVGGATNKWVVCPPIEVTNSGGQITPWISLNMKTTGGANVELMAGIRVNGQHVNLDVADDTATCEIACYMDGSNIPIFELDTGDVGAPLAHHGLFEAEFATVNFTADRGHILIATIVYKGNSYVASQAFIPVP